MFILTLVLVPLVTGLSQPLLHPYPASWSPYHVVRSPYYAVDSTFHPVISPYHSVISPYIPVSSPYQSARSPFHVDPRPYQLVRSSTYVKSSPYMEVLPWKSSPSQDVLPRKNSPYQEVLPQKSFSGLNGDLPAMSSGNFILQARQLTDSLKLSQSSLNLNPIVKKHIGSVVQASNCINSLDEAIETLDTTTNLLESSESEILELAESVRALENLTDIETVMRTSANILQLLEILTPKIVPRETSTTCETPEAFHMIAQVLEDITKEESIHLPEEVKNRLKKIVNILNTVTPFFEYLQTTLGKFDKMCTMDKEYTFEVLYAIADVMDKLADLFIDLVNYEDAMKTRDGARFIRKVVVGLRQLNKDFGPLEFKCEDSDAFKETANTLVDLADLIAEVGVENLGLDLDF